MSKKKNKDDVAKLQEEVKQDASDEVSVADESEIVSTKKVVYAEIDDEVTSVFDKLKKITASHIYIVVPKRALIFKSIVNLKILKRKAKDLKKTIYFVTNDDNGIYLASRLGITVYDKVNGEGKPSLFSTEINDEKLRITPLKASVNAAQEETPTRMAEKKISISEILRRGKDKAKNAVNISRLTGNKTPKPDKKKKPERKFVLVAPNRQALIGLIVVSVFILLTIVYVALPGTTIYLTPTASVLEKSVNITLADYQKNRVELETRPKHMIAGYPISTTVSRDLTHFATGKEFSERGGHASGKITIINKSSTSWPLVAGTRFQSEDGIVFRIAVGVTVEPASSTGLGTAEVFVTADPMDAYGAVAGERGNIGPSTFFLPGLREDSRDRLYAESYEDMTGGVTDFVEFISAQDIEAARARLNDELKKVAYEELKKEVDAKSELVGGVSEFVLLEGDGAIKIGDVKVNLEEGLEGQKRSEFTVSGEVFVSGVYYNRNDMLEILKQELLLKKSPQKDLIRVNEDTTSYRIFEWDENRGKIKLTANIKGIEQYAIDDENASGQKLLEKIKEHILGKAVDEAKVYIQNLPEINKVEIENWPVWAPTIPKLPDNIDFEVRDAVMVK
ncbi:baseplate J/gp47 family protein [Patescibacteria group bacterium]|nr:baseplate J/gp47 family protein [Patescibacteria group bacterium]